MASLKNGRIYIESADAASAVTTKKVKIAYAFFIPDGAADQAVLTESSGDDPAIVFSAATAKEAMLYDFSAKPVILDGIYVTSISSNAQVILYTTTEGRR